MKLNQLLSLLSLAAGLAAHQHHSEDEPEWTREQLDELEAKWGQEVKCHFLRGRFLLLEC